MFSGEGAGGGGAHDLDFFGLVCRTTALIKAGHGPDQGKSGSVDGIKTLIELSPGVGAGGGGADDIHFCA